MRKSELLRCINRLKDAKDNTNFSGRVFTDDLKLNSQIKHLTAHHRAAKIIDPICAVIAALERDLNKSARRSSQRKVRAYGPSRLPYAD